MAEKSTSNSSTSIRQLRRFVPLRCRPENRHANHGGTWSSDSSGTANLFPFYNLKHNAFNSVLRAVPRESGVAESRALKRHSSGPHDYSWLETRGFERFPLASIWSSNFVPLKQTEDIDHWTEEARKGFWKEATSGGAGASRERICFKNARVDLVSVRNMLHAPPFAFDPNVCSLSRMNFRWPFSPSSTSVQCYC